MYDNSLNSLYVIVPIVAGFLTILGSAIKNPETSVQFSYKSTCPLRATIDPVTSLPPRENVFIFLLPSFNDP